MDIWNRLLVAERMERKNQWFVFDVDGTLTESRQEICPSFKRWFLDNMPMTRVALVTGSDREKTVEQVGEDFWSSCAFSIQCCGNEVYSFGNLIHREDWYPHENVIAHLKKELMESDYDIDRRHGNHIEIRTGMLNFSVVGRNAVGPQRKHYAKYDETARERDKIAQRIRDTFWGLDATCGGDTGIDIFPVGKDKSQAVQYLGTNLVFFGDRCDPMGNDYPLAKTIEDNKNNANGVFHVSGPPDVYHYLQTLLSWLSE